jgi:PAS domain-containing protein
LANKACAIMLGYSSIEELIAKEKSTNLYPREIRKQLIEKIKVTGSVTEEVIEFVLHNDKKIWIKSTIHISADGKFLEGSLIDITENKNLEKQILEFKNKYIDQMCTINNQIDSVLSEYTD